MKNTCLPFMLLLLLLVFKTMDAEAQQRFRAGVVAGLNASQIRGDGVAGYNKLGLQGGLRAITLLNDKMDFIIEMLYSQRGSFQKGGSICSLGDLSIDLKYVEVPLLVSYKDWYQEDGDFYKVQVTGGLSYGRLLEAKTIDSCHDAEVVNFHKNDYSFTIGADFFLSKKFGFGARWTRSLNLLYNHKNQPGIDSLVGYFLSFRTMYIF